MGPQELIARIGDPEEEFRPAHGIVPRTRRYDGAQGVGFQFELLAVGSGADFGADLLGGPDRLFATAPHDARQLTEDGRPEHGILALLFEVTRDVMGRFVCHYESHLVGVSGICDQGQGEGDDRSPCLIQSLECVGRRERVVVHDDQKIAIQPRCPGPAFLLGDRLHGIDDLYEGAGRAPDRLWIDRGHGLAGGRGFRLRSGGTGRRELVGHRRRGTAGKHHQTGHSQHTRKDCHRQRTPRNSLLVNLGPRPVPSQSRSGDQAGLRSASLAIFPAAPHSSLMFSIEHDFDATVITLLDEGDAPLKEDVTVNLFEDCVTVEQYDPRRDEVVTLTLSLAQARDLAAALNLPEGIYRRSDGGTSKP